MAVPPFPTNVQLLELLLELGQVSFAGMLSIVYGRVVMAASPLLC